MSSLAERLTQAQSEAAKKIAEEEAIRISSEQAARQATQQANIEAQKKIQEATRQEQERVAALIASLSPLLDSVGARDQLEEVRRIWKVGTIDPSPQLISESPTPSVGLALRHKTIDLELHYQQWMVADGEDGTVHNSSSICLREAALFIIVGQEEGHHNVRTSYAFKNLSDAPFSRYGKVCEYTTLDPKLHPLAQIGPEQFQVADPEHAKTLLENQLLSLLLRTEQPLQSQERMKAEIAKDPFTSLPPAQSYCRSLMRSIRALQPENSVPLV